MPSRSILLRILFWSLALAAVFGAFGTLFSSYQGLWRIAATSIVTAGAAMLFLLASVQMDKPSGRLAASVGVTLIVLEYLLTLAAIWMADIWRDDSMWGTVGLVAACGVPAVGFVRTLGIKLTRIAGMVGIAAAGVIFLLAMVEVWTDWSVRQRLGVHPGEFAGYLVPYAMLAIICLVGVGTDRQFWRLIGVAAAALAYSIVVYALIKHLHGDASVLIYITTLAAVVAHANAMMLVPLRPNQMWLRWLTIAAGIATGFFIALVVAGGRQAWNGGDDMVQRLAGACGIVAGCGSLAMAVLARINRRFATVATTGLTDLREITVICPLCRKKQTVPLGGSLRCAGCNVEIHVRVEEPRCTVCGYSLLMLKSPVCPECGTAVPPASAGAAQAPSSPPPPGQTAYTPT